VVGDSLNPMSGASLTQDHTLAKAAWAQAFGDLPVEDGPGARAVTIVVMPAPP